MEDEGPTGGFALDGRAQSLAEQAVLPLLDVNEMGNADAAAVAARVAASSYVEGFRKVYGKDAFATAEQTMKFAGQALQAFQEEDLSFAPYSSKYDKVLRGEAKLTPAEERGLILFNRKDKGSCAQCHPSWPGPNNRPPQFTDYGHDALGVPRNPALIPGGDPRYFDMGLCGPLRKDLAKRDDLCGRFKTPTLRNVASRAVFFHNGAFHTLSEALHFYVERDTNPERWYPRQGGRKVIKFDDLPEKLRGNVNTRTQPYDRKRGEAPALNDAEIEDVLAFLATLTDDDVRVK
jgi:cytochrome c peroxidase